MTRYDNFTTLGTWLQGKARTLSYNGPDGPLKHKLLEASHAMDSAAVRVSRKGLRLFIRNARGKQRRMRAREIIAFVVLGKKTEIRP